LAPISDQIANDDIGMSRQNVEHHMLRFKDQMKIATDGQKWLRLVNTPDVSK
jgi:biotin operon repressor